MATQSHGRFCRGASISFGSWGIGKFGWMQRGQATESNDLCWRLTYCVPGPVLVPPHMLSRSILSRLGSWSSEKVEFSKDYTAKKYRKMDFSSDLPHSEAGIHFNALNCIKDIFWKADWGEQEWGGVNKLASAWQSFLPETGWNEATNGEKKKKEKRF